MVEWQQTTTSADDHKHQDSVITPEQLAQYPIFSSRWWSRGWTLQELIAPYDVEFYSQEWTYLTSKQACKRFINRKYGIWRPYLIILSLWLSACRGAYVMGMLPLHNPGRGYGILSVRSLRCTHAPPLWGGITSFLPPPRTNHRLDRRLHPISLGPMDAREPGSSSFSRSTNLFATSRASISQTPLGSILATSPRDFSNNMSWSNWISVRFDMPVLGEPLQLTIAGYVLASLSGR